MKTHFSLFFPLLFLTTSGFCQGVGVGTTLPDSSARLEVQSTTQGVLIPRVSTLQRKAIENPANGLLVFDNDKSTLYMFNGIQWLPLAFTLDPNFFPLFPLSEVSDANEGDSLGVDIDIDGEYAIVGAPKDDIGPDLNRGSAYIFHNENGLWVEQAKITSINGDPDDNFGISVGISGDYAIVGAYRSNVGGIDKGSAFIFHRTGNSWNQLARINASDGMGGDYFGYAVDIDGDYAVVGTIGAGTDGTAYVFYKGTAWTTGQPYQAKLVSSAGANGAWFGLCVSLDSNEVLIGDPFEVVAGNSFRGAAYIFTRMDTLWPETARLIASDGAQNDQFGYDVSLDGGYAIIGAHYDQIGIENLQGSAYVYFKGAGWTNGQSHQAKLIANPTGNDSDNFGERVSISGAYALVSAPSKEYEGHSYAGQAFLYSRSGTTWSQVRPMLDLNYQDLEYFGSGLALDDFNILIGAPGKHNHKGEIHRINIE